MVSLPIRNLVTKRRAIGYNRYQVGRTQARDLPLGSPFHITAAFRYNGQIWIRSGANHWYQLTNDLLACAHCHPLRSHSAVLVHPNRPSGAGAYGQNSPANHLFGWSKEHPADWPPQGWRYRHEWGLIPLAPGSNPV